MSAINQLPLSNPELTVGGQNFKHWSSADNKLKSLTM